MPNGLTAADGEVRYTFNQRNLLVQIENHDGSSYLPQAEMNYDGAGNRLQGVSFVLGSAMTTTYTLDSLNNRLPLAVDNGTDTRTILYGLFGLGEFSTAWTYYLGDGQLSVRQLMDGSGNIALSRTYGPFGQILQEAGNGSAIYGFAGAQAGGGGLLYINGRYFDPTTGRFLSPDNNFDPLRPGTLNGYLSAAFLFAPFGVIIWRKRKGGKYNAATWFSLALIIIMGISACEGQDSSPPSKPIDPIRPGVPIPPSPVIPTPPLTPGSPGSNLPPTPGSQQPQLPTPPNTPKPKTPTPCPTPTLPTPTPPSPTPSPTAPFQPMHMSSRGLEFLAQFEAIILNLYNDAANHCTVGIGHLVHLGPCNGDPSEAPFTNGISEQEAYDLFRTDVVLYEQAVNNSVRVALSQEQFDALASLSFNIGTVGLANSRVVAILNQGDYIGAADAWLTQSITGAGSPTPLAGLIRRREFEAMLFRDGIYRTDW